MSASIIDFLHFSGPTAAPKQVLKALQGFIGKDNNTTPANHSIIYRPNPAAETRQVILKFKKGCDPSPTVYKVDEVSMIPKISSDWKKVYVNTITFPSLKWPYTAVTRGIDEIEKF